MGCAIPGRAKRARSRRAPAARPCPGRLSSSQVLSIGRSISLHQILERAAVLHQHRLGQRIEGRIDRRAGRGGDEAAVAAVRRGSRLAGILTASLAAVGCTGGGSGGGVLSSNTRSDSAVDGAKDRRSREAAPSPSARSDRECRRPAPPPRPAPAPTSPANWASIVVDLVRALTLAGSGSVADGAIRGAGAGCGGGSGLRCGALGRFGSWPLATSSSAMIRRMEARISSIEGS